jgi:hypothetical protein
LRTYGFRPKIVPARACLSAFIKRREQGYYETSKRNLIRGIAFTVGPFQRRAAKPSFAQTNKKSMCFFHFRAILVSASKARNFEKTDRPN